MWLEAKDLDSTICHNVVHYECIHLDDIKVLF
jgi:hypothetical protein